MRHYLALGAAVVIAFLGFSASSPAVAQSLAVESIPDFDYIAHSSPGTGAPADEPYNMVSAALGLNRYFFIPR